MKLYIKRNMNELAELTFGENYTCDVGLAQLFLNLLKDVVPGLSFSVYLDFRKYRKIYLGECSEEQLDKAFDTLYWLDRDVLKPYLEIIE